jgi:hypothetical protein
MDNMSTAKSSDCLLSKQFNRILDTWKLDANCNVQRTRFMKTVTTDRIIDKINRLVEEELRTGGGELKILEMIGINKNLEYTQTVITV